jgi:hypothetical protein
MPLLNNFGFGVVGGQEKNGYVALDSGTQYQLKLWNFNTKLRCDAEVKIDGKAVGNFRIEKMDSIVIERPANNRGCFTFYAVGTIEAKMVMLEAVDENSLGLIEIVFYPEKKPTQKRYALREDDDLASLSYLDELECLRKQINLKNLRSDYIPGGTGLSGHSNINYETIESLNYDYDNIVTIYLQLISKKQKSTCPNPITVPIQNKSDVDLTAWIEDQQEKLRKEQVLLKASMDKNKSLKTKEELIFLVVEQEKIMEEYKQKIYFLEAEENKKELIDYWEEA